MLKEKEKYGMIKSQVKTCDYIYNKEMIILNQKETKIYYKITYNKGSELELKLSEDREGQLYAEYIEGNGTKFSTFQLELAKYYAGEYNGVVTEIKEERVYLN